MATSRVIAATVDRAVAAAAVDLDGGCRFDPPALAAVIALCDTEANRAAVLEVVDAALQQAIEALDQTSTLAAVTLRTRIEAATARRQVPVENLQGDVGTGRGPEG